MLMSKAYVCNRCRKAVSYSVRQGGTTRLCPFCDVTLTFPADKDFHPEHPAKKNGGRWVCLFLSAALAGAGGYLLIKQGPQATVLLKRLSEIKAQVYDRVTVAPAPAKVRGSCVTIAVKEMRYGCPDIYHAALKKTLSTEKPVLCVALEITNVGKKQVGFHPWRMPEAAADQNKATLTDSDGSSYGLVSFGHDTYPSGSRQRADIAPGEAFTDWVYFIGDEKPENDLKLALPCENLGGQGELRFTIPCGMIR